jgi:YD repeat-containing protein
MQVLDAAYAKVREVEPFLSPPLRYVREAFERSIAVVLGVNAYGHGIPGLKTAVPDAEAIGALLEAQHGFELMLRRDAEVRGKHVRALFQGLRDQLTEHEERRALDPSIKPVRLLVYFAGHGLSLPSEQGPEGYLLFADADPADSRTFFAMSELRALVSALPCRHVLIVLDCCFAGTFRWAGNHRERSDIGTPAYRETLERFVNHRAWQVLVSASHDQTALDALDRGLPSNTPATRRPFDSPGPDAVDVLGENRLETGQHSPFATALLRGLRGEADFTKDGLIVAAELELFVRDAVEASTQVHQTPQLYKLDEHDRGEFVFQVPDTTLHLEPAPALSLANCPYQGLQSYGASQRALLFGRKRVVEALVDRVKAHPFTALVGPSGVGKSSLLAAGLAPSLRDTRGWRVLEARPGTTPDVTLRDLIKVPTEGGLDPGATLFERITAWMSAYPSGLLCLAVDQAEEFETISPAKARERTFDDIKLALNAHGARLRVVFALRSEFGPLFRASPLAPFWGMGDFPVPVLNQSEAHEIIERPARSHELSFEPPTLVDALIDEVMQAPGALPLLSFALRELYACCVARNQDRLLREVDYVDMGRLSGALATHASGLLRQLVDEDQAYEATARRVFLRMIVKHDNDWLRRRVKRDELVYADEIENRRVDRLLNVFQDARLVVSDKGECEPAHDELVRSWPALAAWRAKFSEEFGPEALSFQLDLADAARRWAARKKPVGYLWHNDDRLRSAEQVARHPDSWLNACEREFVHQSLARRRAPAYILAFAALVLALCSLGTGYAYYWPHVSYYQNYTRRWGAPEGIDRLSESEARHRTASVKFTRKGRLGRVEHVELVRQSEQLARRNEKSLGSTPELDVGQKAEGERLPCQWDFLYDSSGDVISETVKDRAGRAIYTLQYLPSPREQRRAQFFFDPTKGVGATITRGSAEIVEFVRTGKGLEVEKRYYTLRGERARGPSGVSIERFRYDDGLRLSQASFFNEKEKPVRNKEGVATWRAKVDERGNETERAFFDETGAPMRNKSGIASWHATFDAQGNETELTFFDEAGKLVRSREGIAGWRATFDARGNETERAFFDEMGKPTHQNEGVAGYRATFDAQDNETERAFFDETGQPVRNDDGIAGWRATFDAQGNQTERAFFDEAGKPTHHKEGIAGWRATFDARGNQTEHTFFDEAGNVTWHRDGYARWRATFDARGNQTEVALFDEAGKPSRNKYGVARVQSSFDGGGRETERAFFDEASRPTHHKEGMARWRKTFDARGNETERAFFDEVGNPTRPKANLALERRRYDERSNETEVAYFDEAGKPSRDENGAARTQSSFDESGRETERAFFDEAGKPVRNGEGVAGWRATFDARGNETERAFFDQAGKPTRLKNGNASWRATFDARGNRTERTFFDEAGKPIRIKEGIASWRAAFDQWGNQTEHAFFDEAGNPTRHRDGYARWRATFDQWGNQTERAFFDETGKPVRNDEGIAGWRATFDQWGNETERAFFDEAGNSTRLKNGIAGWRSSFDARGNETERAYFDEAGNPTRHKDGNASWRATFDARGNETETTFFDEASKPARLKDGVAVKRAKFDQWGNTVELIFLNEAGQPISLRNGVATVRNRYNDRSELIQRTRFNLAGKPIDR